MVYFRDSSGDCVLSCADTQSYVNIRCHLETFQVLSTNFGDIPRSVTVQGSKFFMVYLGTVDETGYFKDQIVAASCI